MRWPMTAIACSPEMDDTLPVLVLLALAAIVAAIATAAGSRRPTHHTQRPKGATITEVTEYLETQHHEED